MKEEAKFNWKGRDSVVVLETSMVLGGWMSAIGSDGLGLYTLYKCLAQQGVPASFEELAKHTGMAHKTIRSYNLLFAWAGLLHITEGNNRYPNQYDVYAPPELNEELIHKLISHIEADEWFNKDYNQGTKNKFLERLNLARPFGLAARRPSPTPEEQPPLFETTAEPEPDADPEAEVKEAIEGLHQIGCDVEEIKEYLANYRAAHILDWLWHMAQRDGTKHEIGNPREYLRKVIPDPPPKRRPQGHHHSKNHSHKPHIPDDLKGIIKR